MVKFPLALFDAFSETSFGGSVAAVIDHAEELSSENMQRIAKEIGAPATGFITAIGTDAIGTDMVDVRFFSTMTEYPMCGHGTIGLMTWLMERGIFRPENGKAKTIVLRTPAGTAEMELSIRADGRFMVMVSLDSARFEPSGVHRTTIAPMLGIASDDIVGDAPLELTRSDFTHLVVPIAKLDTMGRITPDYPRITELSHEFEIDTISVFSLETENPKSTIHCREFCPAVGTPEAPASGTTNRALACYLYEQQLLQSDSDGKYVMLAEQGIEMGRPSYIRVELEVEDNSVIKARVGGIATKTMEGEFFLN